MRNDLSDEAFNEWFDKCVFTTQIDSFKKMRTFGRQVWDEAKHRAEERERKAFEAGWMAALNQHSGLLVSHGVTDWSIQFYEKWRAYQAERSGQ